MPLKLADAAVRSAGSVIKIGRKGSEGVVARWSIGRAFLAFAMCFGLSAGPADAAWRCRARPIEECVTQHGRLSSQNGRALLIWLVGTSRVVNPDNDPEELPPLVRRYLDMASPDYSYIYGDFGICPLEPDRPGHMRAVCVISAEKLVVQNLRRPRPPFRLLSTWPASGATGGPSRVGQP